MTTRQLGISLHDELDRREKLIAQLQEECGAIRTTLTILERGGSTPEAQNRVTHVVGRGRPKKVKAVSDGGGYRCGCGRTFKRGAELGNHKRACSGKKRPNAEDD